MKKLFLAIAVLFSLQMTAFAGSADLFDLDEAALNEEFSSLTQLEEFVLGQPGQLSLAEISQYDDQLLERLDLNSAELQANMFRPNFDLFTDIEWAAFAWGFCCGPIGVLIVLIGNKGNEYIISSLIGWGVSILMSSAWWVLSI
ncbi:MAG: hypothetical protein ACFB10_01840 [Salibacteraceae bacterium]